MIFFVFNTAICAVSNYIDPELHIIGVYVFGESTELLKIINHYEAEKSVCVINHKLKIKDTANQIVSTRRVIPV